MTIFETTARLEQRQTSRRASSRIVAVASGTAVLFLALPRVTSLRDAAPVFAIGVAVAMVVVVTFAVRMMLSAPTRTGDRFALAGAAAAVMALVLVAVGVTRLL